MQETELARSTGPTGELVLRRRRDERGEDGTAIELRANGVFVMDTVETASEQAMATATLAASRRSGRTPRRVLVGGLGLGFTLAEVLGDAFVEHVTVVEIEPGLVEWMRDGTIPHGPALLADDRVELVTADIADWLRSDAAPAGDGPAAGDAATDGGDHTAYDLALLDVDNGPGYLVHESNADLYQAPLLGVVRERLAEGGTLVIWSAFEEPELPLEMHDVFGNCRALPIPVDLQGREEQYWLYASTR
jgi:spermidine synthase